MNKIEHRRLELRYFDELASRKSVVHTLHPTIKLLTTLVFIAVVASFSKYEIAGLIPMFFYPFLVIGLGNIPIGMIVKRVLFTLPFVLLIGIFNPLFDQAILVQIGPVPISGGVVSFVSIIIRFTLSVVAALLLIATTGIDAICGALFSLGVPRVVVTQILFVYRYLYVLTEEVMKTICAYSLRSPQSDGVAFKAWGSLVGVLLLRAIDRAQRIYQAMLCRGFDGEVRIVRSWQLGKWDIAFLLVWLSFFLIARSFNISEWLGTALLGGHK